MKSTGMKALLVFGLVMGGHAALGATVARASDLGWLSGQWSLEKENTVTDIYYSPARAGSLLGVLRLSAGPAVLFFEYQRIVEEKGTLVLYPTPFGKPGISFTLTDQGSERAVFENPAHDFPRKITYSLDHGDTLHIRVEGIQSGKEVTQELVAVKAAN